MRQIRTFNLAKHVVDDLNREIRRGYRSKFVQDAIQDKLDRKAKNCMILRHQNYFYTLEILDLQC
jgi:metal-responsive CopG/Arc/MetJ family transcriptional regulator